MSASSGPEMVRVSGLCPMGCGQTLFLGEGGCVTCSYVDCRNPAAAHEILSSKPHPLAQKCVCGHAKWAHANGACHASCQCHRFSPAEDVDQLRQQLALGGLRFELDIDAASSHIGTAIQREKEAEQWREDSKGWRRLMRQATDLRVKGISIALKMERDES